VLAISEKPSAPQPPTERFIFKCGYFALSFFTSSNNAGKVFDFGSSPSSPTALSIQFASPVFWSEDQIEMDFYDTAKETLKPVLTEPMGYPSYEDGEIFLLTFAAVPILDVKNQILNQASSVTETSSTVEQISKNIDELSTTQSKTIKMNVGEIMNTIEDVVGASDINNSLVQVADITGKNKESTEKMKTEVNMYRI